MVAPLLVSAGMSVLEKVFGVIDQIVPDKDMAAKLKAALQNRWLDIFQSSDTAQGRVNEAEIAATGKWGWRWAMGWVCVLSLTYSWFLAPFLRWAVALVFLVSGQPVDPAFYPPALDTGEQQTIIMGMLGLAGVRAHDLWRGSRR